MTFLRSWRKEMMKLAAQALEHFDERSGRSYYAILHFKAAHPEKDSTELAARFGEPCSVRSGAPKVPNSTWVSRIAGNALFFYAFLQVPTFRVAHAQIQEKGCCQLQ